MGIKPPVAARDSVAVLSHKGLRQISTFLYRPSATGLAF
jgi:hypothetical protein